MILRNQQNNFFLMNYKNEIGRYGTSNERIEKKVNAPISTRNEYSDENSLHLDHVLGGI